MEKITPFLWFDHEAEEAAQFYVSLFKDSQIGTIVRYGDAGPGPKDSVMTVEFELAGRTFVGLNGGPVFKHTAAFSNFVWCETEAEIDTLWKNLSAKGEIRMALAKYPWAEKYGWTKDRFGVEWQLMLKSYSYKIAPALLFVKDLFGRGQEALDYYLGLFQNSKVEFVAREETTKSILHCVFLLEDEPFVLMEGQGTHDFSFTEAYSLVVNCDSQEEVDSYWEELTRGGFPSQCGWLKDKFGVSWQIVPRGLRELIQDGDVAKSQRVIRALLTMSKLDINKLREARDAS